MNAPDPAALAQIRALHRAADGPAAMASPAQPTEGSNPAARPEALPEGAPLVASAHPNAAAHPPGAEPPAPRVLVVDDTPANLSLLANVLNKRCKVQLATHGEKALALIRRNPPDLVILDVMMPGMDGYAVCREIKADPATRHVPVLFLTALSRPEDESAGFAAGGADFIHKPFNPATVLARVETQLQLKAWQDHLRHRNTWLQDELAARLQEVDQLREATLHVMVSFAEFRDEETGNHVKRTQEYVRALARWLSAQPGSGVHYSDDEIEQLARSAPLHDIGKVAIPDGILLKPGRLTAEEFAIMKTHAVRGWDMLQRAAQRMGRHAGPYLRFGMEIARHHHERWDGSGYPDGLAGAQIPLAARLMAVADVYDALISVRPYKTAMPHHEAMAHIVAGAGSHFDPQLVQALQAIEPEVQAIARHWAD